MVWYFHLLKNFPQFVVIHTVKGFGIVNKAEIDGLLELSCFFNDPTDVGNLISSPFAFSKSSLNIWKFMVHILLKPGLENFEHFPGGSDGKVSACSVGEPGLIPGSGRSPGKEMATHIHALEKEMTPTPVFLPGESQRWGSLVGCHLWGRTESDTTEAT